MSDDFHVMGVLFSVERIARAEGQWKVGAPAIGQKSRNLGSRAHSRAKHCPRSALEKKSSAYVGTIHAFASFELRLTFHAGVAISPALLQSILENNKRRVTWETIYRKSGQRTLRYVPLAEESLYAQC